MLGARIKNSPSLPNRARCFLTACAFLMASASHGSELPAVTQESYIQPLGVLAMDIGIGYRNEPKDYGLPVHDARWDIGKARFALGLGELVEVQFSGTLYAVVENANGTDSDIGDWILGTKIRLFSEKDKRPAIALLWEVKLPSSSTDEGIGTDETDFYAHLLFSKGIGEKNRFDLNFGVGVLGDPADNGVQEDVLIFKTAWTGIISDKNIVGAEFLAQSGLTNGDSPVMLRGIYRRVVGRWTVSGAIGAGLNSDADDFTVDLFIRRNFQMWSP